MKLEELSVVTTVPPDTSLREIGAVIKNSAASILVPEFRGTLSEPPGQAQGADALRTLGDGTLDD